jgi:tungstate transport system ATP-binding protein
MINVSKKYDDKYALRNVTLKGENSKIIAVIGPSGSGKTTLLRIINMLDTPSTGIQTIDGKNPYELSKTERHEIRTKMAMVFQNPGLFQRTVAANVAYGLKIRQVPSNTVDKKVRETLKLVGLERYRDKFAPNLSAGEAQRVSFARAIVVKPQLLLLDEFTANLDHANVKLLEESVIKYHKETKATIVLATHNLFQAKRLADEIIFIFNGEIVEKAEKEEFFSNPQHPLTRSFLSGELVY